MTSFPFILFIIAIDVLRSFKYLLLTLIITTIITTIYYFIEFEIPNLFYNKLQITLFPGIIFVFKAFRMFTGNTTTGYRGIYLSQRLNEQTLKDRIEAKEVHDFTENYIMLAYLTSGIIQITFGILIGNIGKL